MTDPATDPGRTIDVLDPSDTRRVVARVPAMTGGEVLGLYDAAAQAAPGWGRTSPIERGAILARAAALLRERSAEITADLVSEMGKTLAEAGGEVAKAADFFDYYAGFARQPYGQLLADARPGTETSVRTEPLGVVALITPWNDPLITPARKSAPALAAGNAVILKPATDTPLVALHLARALADAGLPAGLFAVAVGRASQISDVLLDDERLAAVSFTGSTEVGRTIQRRVAGRNVRVQTEMGGKNATAILADADLALAIPTVAAAVFGQAGQRCTATSRVVVDRAVADEVIAGLVAYAGSLRVGPGSDPATTMGPLVSAQQQKEVLTHVERAKAEGATVAVGGYAPTEGGFEHGCYVAPTVLTDVRPDMAIWRDEVFGPVAAVRVVDGFDEAVAAVNDSVYGLAAGVFTTSLEHAHEFAARVNAGQVAVNLPTPGWDVHLPFGGFGDSGSPFKEQGAEALRFYTRVKTVAIRVGGGAR
ncbi:aldehyde dehydrogenase family protein [Actinospica sp. MGRD01-02]|uniref:Aldehyde dehydrogenase family protein n=1 Tax=Actinospica acidithermotolerans TaxID=2828514 RepID=A0A941EDG7_9ACTN|nr:aldehyde dehydrogenase family protein [Actinospica acidithermotolerans]MBR7828400.1 aldehyde dehydrogenase family protein [Actinospica acidithermotolerans]